MAVGYLKHAENSSVVSTGGMHSNTQDDEDTQSESVAIELVLGTQSAMATKPFRGMRSVELRNASGGLESRIMTNTDNEELQIILVPDSTVEGAVSLNDDTHIEWSVSPTSFGPGSKIVCNLGGTIPEGGIASVQWDGDETSTQGNTTVCGKGHFKYEFPFEISATP